MVPLAAVSVWMWALILLKMREFDSCIRQERHIHSAELKRNASDIHGAQWQRNIAAAFLQGRSGVRELDRNLLESILSRSIIESERHLGMIAALAAIAPLLGLLGTVGGMITTFDVIAAFGTGNARALSSGISEALITTQAGLVVSVPGLLMGGILRQRARRLHHRMRHFGVELFRELEPPLRSRLAGCP